MHFFPNVLHSYILSWPAVPLYSPPQVLLFDGWDKMEEQLGLYQNIGHESLSAFPQIQLNQQKACSTCTFTLRTFRSRCYAKWLTISTFVRRTRRLFIAVGTVRSQAMTITRLPPHCSLPWWSDLVTLYIWFIISSIFHCYFREKLFGALWRATTKRSA